MPHTPAPMMNMPTEVLSPQMSELMARAMLAKMSTPLRLHLSARMPDGVSIRSVSTA